MFSSENWFGASPSFYNGVATQSLRFDQSSSAFLHRTPDSGGNQQIWTFSTWYKLGSTFDSTLNILTPHTGGDGSNESQMMIDYVNHGGKLRIYDSGGTRGDVQTSRIFRDPSAWYNIVISLDLTQGTDTNRVKIYVNGVQETLAGTFPSQNTSWGWNGTSAHRISSLRGGTPFQDGYLSETIMVDGTQLAPTSFGETKNGVWIPIKYTGSYGTNGFRLQFNQTGVGSGSSSTIGADTSGNTNHFTSSGIVASDCAMPDSPENNFATLNSISEVAPTLSEGNLAWSMSGYQTPATSTFSIPSTGKWYWEVRVTAVGEMMIGVQTRANLASSGRKTVYYREGGSGGGSGSIYIEGTGYSGDQASYTNGDIIAVLYNADDMEISWRKNGTQQGLTFDVTDTDVTPIIHHGSGSGSNSGVFNFGQDSTFLGAISAGGNADGNGIGDFAYAPPSGFLALCTSNLPEPTISPNADTQADDYFNTVLYTGDGNNSRTVTGVGFQPDWLWIKRRDGANSHVLVDSSRGSGSNDSLLSLLSNVTDAEYDLNDHVRSLDSDGFTLDDDTDNTVATNNSSQTYVAWNWKANGGTTSSNTDGSITSTVQANTDAGFSIVTYTGNGSAGATIGHSLGANPAMIIVKGRTNVGVWAVYRGDLGGTERLLLNLTSSVSSDVEYWNNTNATSSVFTVRANSANNGSGQDYVAYCWSEVEGYSKFGSYTGNGSTDGTFVYTGFRPAWVMTKSTTISANWTIIDTTRKTFNLDDARLHPDLSDGEYSNDGYGWDMLSNGFKHRTTVGTFNSSGTGYIYMAFAESPFKYANAR